MGTIRRRQAIVHSCFEQFLKIATEGTEQRLLLHSEVHCQMHRGRVTQVDHLAVHSAGSGVIGAKLAEFLRPAHVDSPWVSYRCRFYFVEVAEPGNLAERTVQETVTVQVLVAPEFSVLSKAELQIFTSSGQGERQKLLATVSLLVGIQLAVLFIHRFAGLLPLLSLLVEEMFAKESVSEIPPRSDTLYLRFMKVSSDHVLP